MPSSPKLSIEEFISQNLSRLAEKHQLRKLYVTNSQSIDFASNDYLGIARQGLKLGDFRLQGATGSRLLTGNTQAMLDLEYFLADFHNSESALIFGSGYEANIGLISTLVDRNSILIYDAHIHRSVRDACRIALGASFAFRHNDLEDLASKLSQAQGYNKRLFVCVESLYSMAGDLCPLAEVVELCEDYGANLLVDEAHSTGVFGKKGEGLVQAYGLENRVFARVHTFGKAVGVYGAVVIGSELLRKYLINKASSYIYTTALPSTIIHSITQAYSLMEKADTSREQINSLIEYFHSLKLDLEHSQNPSPIQAIFVPQTQVLLELAHYLNQHGLLLLPIRYPTVPKNQECLRICLHTFNTKAELDKLRTVLANFVKSNKVFNR